MSYTDSDGSLSNEMVTLPVRFRARIAVRMLLMTCLAILTIVLFEGILAFTQGNIMLVVGALTIILPLLLYGLRDSILSDLVFDNQKIRFRSFIRRRVKRYDDVVSLSLRPGSVTVRFDDGSRMWITPIMGDLMVACDIVIARRRDGIPIDLYRDNMVDGSSKD